MTLPSKITVVLLSNVVLGLSWMHGCKENQLPPSTSMTVVRPQELEGEWGGSGARLIFESDRGNIRYDCAYGTISGPIRVNSRGNFIADGTHVAEKPGPIQPNERPEEWPVRYEGDLRGDELELRVTRKDNGEGLGDFLLVKGSQGRVKKCR
jgi:hypothetical protein